MAAGCAAAAPASPPPPGFYEWREHFPALQALVDAVSVIREEAAGVTRWTEWPEQSLYKAEAGHDWRVVPFVHTFPADDPTRTAWVASACDACPRTAALLRALPGVRTALFSRMGPGTSLASHSGWAQLSNHVLRCHVGVDVPGGGGGPVSGVVVGDDIRYHADGQVLCFDDSLVHSAFNNHGTAARVVLIVDLPRPPGAAPGSAIAGTTPELEAFVSHFH